MTTFPAILTTFPMFEKNVEKCDIVNKNEDKDRRCKRMKLLDFSKKNL